MYENFFFQRNGVFIKQITTIIPIDQEPEFLTLSQELFSSGFIQAITLATPNEVTQPLPLFCYAKVSNPFSAEAVKKLFADVQTPYILFFLNGALFRFRKEGIRRMLRTAESTGAALIYSDFTEHKNTHAEHHPLLNYQPGSARDTFDFGSVVLLNTALVQSLLPELNDSLTAAGWYELRLRLSEKGAILRIPEPLYDTVEYSSSSFGQAQFLYVTKNARDTQLEFEHVFTEHLRRIHAFLQPAPILPEFPGSFPVEASVIIPVKNRFETIRMAVDSALSQKTKFPFNCIVVDNHSDDGTSSVLFEYASKHDSLIHVIPVRTDLGIGGCWFEAVNDRHCGKFAVQLDSDDTYADETVLQRIVDTFYSEKCGAVVGSYILTNYALEEIPPGLIDHREWTHENGLNNALRINGFGAPRAYYSPLLCMLGIPNVSYGEDYAVMLAISRMYKIGRIFDPLYFCRRWENNSDAALSTEQANRYSEFKDTMRTFEICTRQRLNLKTEVSH